MSADFIDSNIFVYLFDDVDLQKQGVAERLVAGAIAGNSGVISYQVVQEVLNVLDRKLGVPSEDLRRLLDAVLLPLWQVAPSPQLYRRALDIRSAYGYSLYDSLIVAGALGAGCLQLFSEDLHHGQRIDGLTVINPFR